MVMKMKKKLFSTIILITLLASVLPSLPVMASPSSSLVGSWNFDKGTGSTATDSSGNGNDGTLSGGKFGNALVFDGVDDYVEIPNSVSMDVSSAYTIEAWIYLPSSGTSGVAGLYRGFFRRGSLNTFASEIEIYTQPYVSPYNGKLTVAHNRGGTFGYRYFTPFPLDQWVHLAVTWDGTTSRAYYNEIEQSSTGESVSDATESNKASYIGKGYYTAYMKGKIDEVRVSGIARTSFDTSQAPKVDDDTVALWHFDESIGNTVFDATSNHNDGTINGAIWAGPTWVSGHTGYALEFDGIDDYVEVADSPSLDITSAIYIGAWVYPHALGSWDRVIAKGAGLSLSEWAYVFGISDLGGIYFALFKGGSQTYIRGATLIQTNQWTHIEATWDGSTMKIFINGEVQMETASFTGPITTTSNNLKFGLAPYGGTPYAFDGILDELCIWNVVLPLKLNFLSTSSSIIPINTPASLIAKLTDEKNNPVEGIPITFSGTGLTFTPNPSSTGSSGEATTTAQTSIAGVYTITGTATTPFDPVSDTWTLVVYDPSGGFVTGGGWIYSPAGAYTLNAELEGKATFGFVSKYQKGANVPTGNTEFQFRAAGMNFKGTSYDWLVVAGSRAQYKGTGTINGLGVYKFLLTAIDGQINGGGGVDKFRIKIWDSTGVIYDNQLGDADTADPSTVIAGGSIVIHK